jgi:hypothetical protein
MIIIQMSSGSTFDGLDHTTISTDAPVSTTRSNNAAYFVGTDASNQFRTGQTNMDFQITNSTPTPTFTFKNNIGETSTTTIVAGNAKFSEVALEGLSGNSDILLDIQGYSSSVNPLVRINRNSSSDGKSVSVTNTSTSNETLAIINNTTATSAPALTCFAPNITTSNSTNILIGKNNSSNSNAYYLKYIYDTSQPSRRFVIQAYGENESLSVYPPNISATSTSGTLVVNGGISSSNIYSAAAITGGTITGSSLNLSSGGISCGQITSTGINIGPGAGAISSSGTITGTTQTLTKSTPGQILNLTSSESTSTSTNTGLFLVRHNSNSITGDLYTLAEFFSPNMPTTTSSEIRIGRNATSGASYNAFSSMFGYTYNTTESLRKGYLRLNNSSNTIEFFKPSVVGTTASTGSVVINGDIAGLGLRATSLNLYETSSSANAVKLQTATSSSAYTLKFPTNLGSTNDYLQLGASGQLQWSAGTGGGSGGSAAYVSAAAYTGASTSYASSTTWNVVAFATNVYDVNTSIGYNPSPGTYPYFRNNSGGTIYVQINASIVYSGSTGGSTRQAELRTTTTSSVDPIGGTFTAVITSAGNPNTTSNTQTCNIAGIVKLLSNECFIIVTRQSSGASLTATGQLQFQVLGGSGLQSITLNSVSSFLTGTAQTTGLNPTINVGLSQTPTGSGNTLVTNASPTITNIYLRDGLGFNLVSLEAASGTSNYSFIFPTTSGSSGQILTSDGGSSATKWADVGTYIGTSSSSVTSPLLTLDGTATSNTIPNLLVRDYRSSTLQIPVYILAPNLATTQEVALRIGKSNATNESCRIGFNFVSAGSYLSIRHYSQNESINIYSDSINSTSSTTGTLVVNGGIGVSGKSVYGSSSLNVDSSPTIEIRGISTADTSSPLVINNNSSTAVNAATITALTPSLPVGQESLIRLGVGLSTLNSGAMRFYYAGLGSTSNYVGFNLFNQNTSLKIYKDSVAATNNTTGTLVVNGGIGCSSISTSSISTNTLTIASTDYTPTGGTQSDLTLWWSYSTSDPNVTFTYPSIPYQHSASSGQITNQMYYWQKIGKSYTFSLTFYATFTYTQKQLHLVFLRMSSHTPPTPACGPYTMGVDGTQTSTVKFGLGLYIPAMYFYN